MHKKFIFVFRYKIKKILSKLWFYVSVTAVCRLHEVTSWSCTAEFYDLCIEVRGEPAGQQRPRRTTVSLARRPSLQRSTTAATTTQRLLCQ